ncbi:MAG: ABC transporter ATP-binding protein [Christensenellaceae bacterium]|nr:ABC transporter ATP-binding protein [Christensenellaceae bacterium]
MEEYVKVSNLSYAISSKEILNNVSIQAKKGQFVGIVGPNGSGKTTLLRHIYRVLPVEENQIYIDGRDISGLSLRDSAKLVTVMRQEMDFAFDYKVLEIVMLGRSPHKKVYQSKNQEDFKIVLDALNYVGMADYKDEFFSNLSGGEKQRVLMARSLAQRAEIFILDEPTNHLDVYYQWHLMSLIKDLKKTVISVFHDFNLTLEFCDYVYVLNEGSVVAQGEPEKVLSVGMFEEIFRVSAENSKTTAGHSRVMINQAL